MEPLVGIGIGVDTRVVSGELLHLVETVIGRISHRLVAQVPLTGEVRCVTILLEELGNGWSLGLEVVLVAGGNHDRQGRADGNASGDERGATGGAARLAIPAGKDRTLLGHLVDVRCWVAKVYASPGICTEVIPPGVIGH